jgi:hypothetical protein
VASVVNVTDFGFVPVAAVGVAVEAAVVAGIPVINIPGLDDPRSI